MDPAATQAQFAKLQRILHSQRILHADQIAEKTNLDLSLNAIIDAIHEPILILNRELTIQSVNKAFLKKFTVTKRKTIGINLIEQAKHIPQMGNMVTQLKKLSKNNTSFEELEVTYPFLHGGKRTMLVNAKSIIYDKKHTGVILLSIEDITRQRLVERQKDDFVGYVTHELKTPITSLSAFIQLLQGYHAKTGDKKSQFLLAKAAEQLQRLTSLLSSFTHVYQAQTGKLELHKESIDLYELVRETVETFQYTTSTHAITIDGNITKPIIADKERIRQVIINLLINAIKYSPEADTIIVHFKEEPQQVIVSVTDFGPGIPKEAQSHIFERFFRLNDKSEYTAKGLGLGLYIALEIVKAHKGKLWVESNPGEGATFLFSLPFDNREIISKSLMV